MVHLRFPSNALVRFRLWSGPIRTHLHSRAGFRVKGASCRLGGNFWTARLLHAARVETPTVIRPSGVRATRRDTASFTKRHSRAGVLVHNGIAPPAGACATSSTAALPAGVIGEHGIIVSHSSILNTVSLRSKPKSGSAVWLPVGSASLLFPFCFSFFLTSTAGASVVRAPSQWLPRESFSTVAVAHSSSTVAVADPSALAHYTAPLDRKAGPLLRKTGTAHSKSFSAKKTNALADSGNKEKLRCLVSSGSSNRRNPSWDSGIEIALSRPRRTFSTFSFVPLPVLGSWLWPRRAKNRTRERVAAEVVAPSSPTKTIRTRKFSSFLHSKPRTMAIMDGFDPKDPQQAADVVLVPTLSDNYAYLLIDRETKNAACVDPAEPQKVLDAARKEGVKLTLCLCTHKHYDHAGGNESLAKMVPGIEIVGSAYEETPGVNKPLKNKDTVNLGENLRIEALHAPCHTAGHLLYFVTNAKQPTLAPILFSGDTLFVGGCGRFFEGSPQQMFYALMNICGSLPSNTRVYCGHEYTKANLEFALTIEPDNEDLKDKYKWATQQRSMGHPTIPSTIAQEKCYNPFMRVETNSVQSAVGALGDPVETMRLLRERKNAFK